MTKSTPDHPGIFFDAESTVDHETNLTAFFAEKLRKAFEMLRLSPTHETISYLLFLLERHVKLEHDDTEEKQQLGFERPAAFMLGDAVEAAPSHRIEAYRKLGDACLYNCGFFDARITRRAVSASYYKRMGRDAYASVAELVQRSPGQSSLRQIFAELAEQFEGIVAAFKHLATGRDPREQLFERIRRGENVSVEELMRAGVLVGQTASE